MHKSLETIKKFYHYGHTNCLRFGLDARSVFIFLFIVIVEINTTGRNLLPGDSSQQ